MRQTARGNLAIARILSNQCLADEGIKDTAGVVTMGNAFQDFAEVAGRRLPHAHGTPPSNGSRSRRERNTASIWSLVNIHERCGSSAMTAHLKRW